MSGDTNVEVKMEETPEKPSRFAKVRKWVGRRIAGEPPQSRVERTWDRMHREGGFVPLLTEGDLEVRTKEIKKVLNKIEKRFVKSKTPEELQKAMYRSNMEVFNLFHVAGSQWYRGLDDRELADKIRSYLILFALIGDNPDFTLDLFTCSMQMLNLSWKALDVTRVPPYLIETKTIIQPEKARRTSMDDASEIK